MRKAIKSQKRKNSIRSSPFLQVSFVPSQHFPTKEKQALNQIMSTKRRGHGNISLAAQLFVSLDTYLFIQISCSEIKRQMCSFVFYPKLMTYSQDYSQCLGNNNSESSIHGLGIHNRLFHYVLPSLCILGNNDTHTPINNNNKKPNPNHNFHLLIRYFL